MGPSPCSTAATAARDLVGRRHVGGDREGALASAVAAACARAASRPSTADRGRPRRGAIRDRPTDASRASGDGATVRSIHQASPRARKASTSAAVPRLMARAPADPLQESRRHVAGRRRTAPVREAAAHRMEATHRTGR
jgi:hypothetical protein